MTAWLAITLMGPLASFGERPGNVERSTADRPTRSALIGLAGAALGIRRDDHEGQRRLAASFRIATETFGAGTPLTDFHTYQSLPSAARPAPQTRAEALARGEDLVTSISRRDYRADVWFEAAYAVQEEAVSDREGWSLEALRAAFLRPRFLLSLGRRSCPLAAPLNPQILEGTAAEVFALRRRTSAWTDRATPLHDRRAWRHRGGTVAAERPEDLGPASALANSLPYRHRRRDAPGDRLRWQFDARDEFVLSAADAAAARGEGGQ